jgi:hypothetical protein
MRFNLANKPIAEDELDGIEDAIEALQSPQWVEVRFHDGRVLCVERFGDKITFRDTRPGDTLSTPTFPESLRRASQRVAREIVRAVGVA